MSDNTMLNILKGFDQVEKKTLNESALAECGMDTAPSQPVSVNLSAGSAGEMAMILRALAGIGGTERDGLMASPMDDPDIPGRDDVEGDQDLDAGIIGKLAGAGLGALGGAALGSATGATDALGAMGANAGSAAGSAIGKAAGQGALGQMASGAIGSTAGSAIGKALPAAAGAAIGAKVGDKITGTDDDENESIEEWDNEPDEAYSDHDEMIHNLSGGMNREKKMYKPAAPGDNPMAVESIKDRLWAALNEKKAKPDFLDMDKDGNKKEPMKKAIADKKKNPFKKK